MRIAFAALLALIAVSAAGEAQAQNYPWCAILSGDLGGVTSCAFSTPEQCRATVSGVGGFCIQNPSGASAPAGVPRRVKPRP